jgi:hypothetical protein
MEGSEKENQPQDNRRRNKIPPTKSKPKLTAKVGNHSYTTDFSDSLSSKLHHEIAQVENLCHQFLAF